MLFLTTMPLWLSGFLLIGPPTLIAMAGPVVIRRYVKLNRLRINNEIAGFKFATVGVIYAVLLAFAIIIVWEKFNDADSDVAKEAGAAATIYRVSNGIGAEQSAALRDAMTAYLKAAIDQDWPAMERGKDSHNVTTALNDAYAVLMKIHAGAGSDPVLTAEILHQLDQVTAARRARLVAATGTVPGIVWMVLFGGAALTIAFTFFFGAENLRAQMMMTGSLSILIFSGLLTVVAIDHPFAGTVKVTPEALSLVLQDFAGVTRP